MIHKVNFRKSAKNMSGWLFTLKKEGEPMKMLKKIKPFFLFWHCDIIFIAIRHIFFPNYHYFNVIFIFM